MKGDLFMKRKVLVSMGMCLMLFFSFATMTQAGYVNFDVTVAANGNHPDPLSPRMQKEDSENRYYVTPTSFSNTGEIRGFSKTLDWSNTSYPVSMRSNAVNVTVDNPYLGNGPVGQWCCLSTYWGQSSVTNVLRPLINDFLRKMAKFRHQENQDVSAGTRIRFFIDKPAAMISFPRAVIKYL